MGSSEARKTKRNGSSGKWKSKDHSAPKPEYEPTKKRKLNRGRTEYRNVTRTAKRVKNEETEDAPEEEQDGESDVSGVEEEQADELVLDKGKAYDALLTLLTTEHDEEEEEEENEEDGGQQEELEEEEVEDSDVEEEGHIAGVVEEDDPADDIEDEYQSDSDDSDEEEPFEYHFNNVSEQYLRQSINALKPQDGKPPRWNNSKNTLESHSCLLSLPPIEASKKFSKFSNTKTHLKDFTIKQRLLEKIDEEKFDEGITSTIIDPIMSYKDVLFPYESYTNESNYRDLYSLHVLNHIHKTRDKILKNNERLRTQNEKITNGELKPEDEKEFRDQGFTRPKVLILLPTRNSCYQVVEKLISLSNTEQVENQRKFKNQFFEDSIVSDTKPDDFQNLFKGNTNDFFCLGIKLTRKTMKLYSSFYTSDIILASPIGLQMILENPDKRKRQTDFLSSIEIFIMDQAHAIELQNWDHVLTVLKHLNAIPKQIHEDTDFSRVRMWSIEDEAKYLTQTLIFTEYNTPNINNLISRSSNIFGKFRFRSLVPIKSSGMYQVGLKIKQIFTRFESTSPFNEPDERFNHFKSSIIPTLSKQTSYEDGLLIYIPSYTDFIRIKNYMHDKTSLYFCDVNEYSSQKELSRSRALFQQGRKKILLYTERLHHYRRFELKGVKNIFMYGVPNNPIFYKEIVSSIGRSVYEGVADFDISTVRCLYSKWDALALERVVGTDRAPVLTHGQNEFYEFR